MTKENFLRYAALKAQEKSVKEELEQLQPKILDEIPLIWEEESKRTGLPIEEIKKRPITVDEGDFITTTRKLWKYTPQYEILRAALKEREKEEQAKGIATFTEERGLMFKPKVIESVE